MNYCRMDLGFARRHWLAGLPVGTGQDGTGSERCMYDAGWKGPRNGMRDGTGPSVLLALLSRPPADRPNFFVFAAHPTDGPQAEPTN